MFAKGLGLGIYNLHFVFPKLGLLSLLELGIIKDLSSFSFYFSTKFASLTDKPIFYFCGVDLDNIDLQFFLQSAFIIYQGFFYHNILIK